MLLLKHDLRYVKYGASLYKDIEAMNFVDEMHTSGICV